MMNCICPSVLTRGTGGTLGPEQLITATPRSLVAEVAAGWRWRRNSPLVLSLPTCSVPRFCPNWMRIRAGTDGSNHRDMLPADVLADLNKSAPAITSITREMLPADVLADLNKSAPAVGPITLSMLDAEVTAKLDSNSGTTIVNNPPAVGSLIAIPYGQSAPTGYSMYQRGTPKELVWEEFALPADSNVSGRLTTDGNYYTFSSNISFRRLDLSSNSVTELTSLQKDLGSYSLLWASENLS